MAQVSVPVQRAATAALYDALPFVAKSFEDAQREERNAIMMAVCTATQVEDAAVKYDAFQCISRIAELYYDFLED
jgi:importin subunit beta-1